MKDKSFLIDECDATLKVNRKREFILTLNAPKHHADIKITEAQAKEWVRKLCPGDSWKEIQKEIKDWRN
jgi:hypothetical protein